MKRMTNKQQKRAYTRGKSIKNIHNPCDDVIIAEIKRNYAFFRTLKDPSIEVCKAAISIRYSEIKYIKNKPDYFYIHAMKENDLIAPWIDDKYSTFDQKMKSIKNNPRYINHFNNPDARLIIAAIEIMPSVINKICHALITDKIQTKIIKNNPHVVRSNFLFSRKNYELAVDKVNSLIEYVHRNVSEKTVKKYVENNISYIYMLDNPSLDLQFKAGANGLFHLINNPHKSVIVEYKLTK